MKLTKWNAAIAIVALVTISSTSAYATHVFTDVDDDRFYSEPAEWGKDNGITFGCGDGTTFCPEDPVTRGENITFAFRYDKNIVQPALTEIDARLDTAAADIDAAQADIADAESDIGDNAHNIAVVASDVNNATRVYFARVAADGEVEQTSSEELEVSKDGAGFYEVTVPENADNCVATATTHFHAEGGDLVGGLTAAMMHGNVVTFHDTSDLSPIDEISVLTYTGDPGIATDMPFSITVSCSDPEFIIFDPGVLIPPVISLGD